MSEEQDYRDWLMRHRVVSRSEAERVLLGPLRAEVLAWQRRVEAEAEDRRAWIGQVKRRLGLVDEVHRCRVYGDDENIGWAWSCRRWECRKGGHGYSRQEHAFRDAFAHARAYLPGPPEEQPVTELDLAAFDAAWARMRAQQDAFAAALPARVGAVAAMVNAVMPDGMRFDWTTEDGS